MKKLIITLAILIIFLSGCEYFVLPSAEDTICEPPNQLVRDVNGNLVCITVDGEEESSESIEEKVEQVIEEQSEEVSETPEVQVEVTEGPTGAVVVETSESVLTGETEATVTELPRRTVTEGEFVSFPNLRATDPDGDPISYTFTAPLNVDGEWQTRLGDAGEYKITIVASDGKQETQQDIILVVDSKNKPPVIQVVKSVFVNEGETVRINPTAKDPDGDRSTITISGWMDSTSKSTNFDSAGTYTVKVTASDGVRSSTENVVVVVNNVNRPPSITRVTSLDVTQGEKLQLDVDASDPDDDPLTFSFSSPISSDGTWQTSADDLGEYQVVVTASDGVDSATREVTVTVGSANKPPSILIADVLNFKEGEMVILDVETSDPEGDDVALTYSGWMVTDRYLADYQDAGSHPVVISATDGSSTVTKEITIVVANVNRAPSFDPGAFN